jgi:hypothetical protein
MAQVPNIIRPTDFPVVVTLPKRFYEDHVGRDLPAGTLVAENPQSVTVSLDAAGWDDLVADAKHYVTGFDGEPMRNYVGLISSARATLKRLSAVSGGGR